MICQNEQDMRNKKKSKKSALRATIWRRKIEFFEFYLKLIRTHIAITMINLDIRHDQFDATKQQQCDPFDHSDCQKTRYCFGHVY